jgi:hypothetical protein
VRNSPDNWKLRKTLINNPWEIKIIYRMKMKVQNCQCLACLRLWVPSPSPHTHKKGEEEKEIKQYIKIYETESEICSTRCLR